MLKLVVLVAVGWSGSEPPPPLLLLVLSAGTPGLLSRDNSSFHLWRKVTEAFMAPLV